MNDKLQIRKISAAETYHLRQTVLRPGYPPENSRYPLDHDRHTEHFGAFLNDELVGVATVFPEQMPGQNFKNAWRLRGMAVAENLRGRGIGKKLLQVCLDSVKNQNGDALWCNGRTTALEFYRSVGFETVGAEFDVPESGAHYVMLARL